MIVKKRGPNPIDSNPSGRGRYVRRPLVMRNGTSQFRVTPGNFTPRFSQISYVRLSHHKMWSTTFYEICGPEKYVAHDLKDSEIIEAKLRRAPHIF